MISLWLGAFGAWGLMFWIRGYAANAMYRVEAQAAEKSRLESELLRLEGAVAS